MGNSLKFCCLQAYMVQLHLMIMIPSYLLGCYWMEELDGQYVCKTSWCILELDKASRFKLDGQDVCMTNSCIFEFGRVHSTGFVFGKLDMRYR